MVRVIADVSGAMMRPTALFRACIVSSILLQALASLVDVLFPALVPEALRHAQEAVTSGDLRVQDYVLIAVGVPMVITFLAAAAGLYRFHSWAPRVALYVTLASFLIYPLVDAEVFSFASSLMSDLSMLLWGIVLAMAFLPPVSERFRRLPANSSMQPTGRERPAAD